MKFIIKFLIISFIIFGAFLTTYNNPFSDFMYKIVFSIENTKEHIYDILLQNKKVNNSSIKTDTSELMNEYFITIFEKNLINETTKPLLISSNFSILNLKNETLTEDISSFLENLNKKNLLILNNTQDSTFQYLNEELYRCFKYDNFSFSYLKPKLLNNKDLLELSRYLKALNENNFIPITLIDKNNLNPSLLKSVCKKDSLFIVLNETPSLSSSKNIPILYIGNESNFNFIYQINLFISNSKLKKVRFKFFPFYKNGEKVSPEDFKMIFEEFNKNSKLKFDFNENVDYIYFDYDILTNSY